MNVGSRHRARAAVSVVMAVSVMTPPSAPVAAWQAAAPQTPTKTAAAPPAKAAAAEAAQPPDGKWPRAYTTDEGDNFVVYQPQIASWDDQKKMVAYSAVAYTAKGAETQKPALGTVKVEADTRVSTPERLVDFSNFKIIEANFSTLKKEQTASIAKEITDGFPAEQRVIALDRVLQSIDTSKIIPRNVEGIKADPPVIFFSTRAAVLVNLDGDVIWGDVKGLDLKFAVNTNWDLFQHTPTNTFYLRRDQNWLKATDLRGPWGPVDQLPDSFKKLPIDDENWKDVRAAVPGKKLSASEVPTVFVSTKPAEIILLKGEPKYEEVPDTDLLWVSNTESDVFRMGKTGLVYFLVAGRWFSAADFTGPWTFASLALPEDFKKIPLEHDRSRVLAAVPGTAQAAESVLLASVPQTARVNKKTIQAPEVAYDGGQPKFEPIEKTTVSRAVNTDKDIIKVGDLYYMCFQGVWFMAKAPDGPWEVTGKVPEGDLRDSGQLAVLQRDLRHRRRRQRRVGDVRRGGRVHGRDDCVGLRGVGHGLLLSAVLLRRRLSPLLPDLRLRRVLQPVDRRLRSWLCGLRSVRRRGLRRAVQPENRRVFARRGRVRSVRRSGRRRSL